MTRIFKIWNILLESGAKRQYTISLSFEVESDTGDRAPGLPNFNFQQMKVERNDVRSLADSKKGILWNIELYSENSEFCWNQKQKSGTKSSIQMGRYMHLEPGSQAVGIGAKLDNCSIL